MPADISNPHGTALLIGGMAEGLRLCHVDARGQATPALRVAPADQASFLCLGPRGDRVYAVRERAQDARIDSYAWDGLRLDPMGSVPCPGAGPCHLAARGNWLASAQYRGDNVALWHLGQDGQPEGPPQVFAIAGTGQHPTRQLQAHPHGVTFNADASLLFVPSLGSDTVWLFRRSEDRWTGPEAAWREQPGAGPRHLVFEPGEHRAWLANELANTLVGLDWDAGSKRFTEFCRHGTLPPGFAGPNTVAELALDPLAPRILVSNRGHDSLASFPLDGGPATGFLPGGGKTPRHFAFAAGGALLAVANQDSDRVVLFLRPMPQAPCPMPPPGFIPTCELASPRPTCVLELPTPTHP